MKVPKLNVKAARLLWRLNIQTDRMWINYTEESLVIMIRAAVKRFPRSHFHLAPTESRHVNGIIEATNKLLIN